jgi:hypothetical protein
MFYNYLIKYLMKIKLFSYEYFNNNNLEIKKYLIKLLQNQNFKK